MTLTPSLWISETNAIGMKTARGKGGGTVAHPEIALMFRAWLYPEFMLELVMGFEGYRTGKEIGPYHYLYQYTVQTEAGTVVIGESFSYDIDDYAADLDDDGLTELICNCVSGADGVASVQAYHRNGGLIECGRIDYDKMGLSAWKNRGVHCLDDWYDSEHGIFLVDCMDIFDDTEDGHFICEADYSVFAWERYANVPEQRAD